MGASVASLALVSALGGKRTRVIVGEGMARGYLVALVLVAAGCGSSEPVDELNTRNDVAVHTSAWLAKFDRNRDRRLDKSEWQSMMRRDFPDTAEEDRRRWGDRDFAEYDSNGDGFVEAEEITGLALQGFDCMDTDRDGRISSSERTSTKPAPDPACERTVTLAE